MGMLTTATAWLAVDDGGGFGVGLVLAARMLPNLLFGLAAGTLADRFERTRQLLAVSLAALPLMLALNRLAASGSVPLWQLAVLSFATGCLSVFDTPARQALVMDVVKREVAANAMALNALATRVCIALGALLAGVLIPFAGVATCYVVVAGAYVVSATLILAVQSRTSGRTARGGVSFGRAIRDGARLIVDVPAVRTLMVAGVACEIFGFSYQTAVPVVARDVIGAGAEGLGMLSAAASIGGTLAVVLLSVLPRRAPRERIMSLVFVAYGISLLTLAGMSSLVAAAAVLVVTGACAASFDLLQQTLLQLAVTEDQRGRAVGVWVLGIGSAPVGHLEMGVLVAALGAPSALMINGLAVVVCALLLITSAPLYRWSISSPQPSASDKGAR
jgi:MFS family permease